MNNLLVILLRYSPDIDASWLKKNIPNKNLIEVWTSGEATKGRGNLNEAYEFSGYQEGLKLALAEAQGRKLKILFLNDTAFSSHLSLFTKFLVKKMCSICISDKQPLLLGLHSDLNKKFSSKKFSFDEYISSWIFLMSADQSLLSGFEFYHADEIRAYRDKKLYSNFSAEYIEHLENWLNPTSFLRGWHSSLPFVPLETNDLERKKMTIYLEHSLSAKNKAFSFVDIENYLIGVNKVIYRLLRFCDRCYGFVNKMAYRFKKIELIIEGVARGKK